FSFLYGLTGSTNVDHIGTRLAQIRNLAHDVALSHLPGDQGEAMRQALRNLPPFIHSIDPVLLQLLPILAFVLVAVGLFFKVAAVPFHQWAPDVYEGAPTPVTTYVSMASKTASFALLLRLFLYVFTISRTEWIYLVAGVAIASLTWGNLAALTQTNI